MAVMAEKFFFYTHTKASHKLNQTKFVHRETYLYTILLAACMAYINLFLRFLLKPGNYFLLSPQKHFELFFSFTPELPFLPIKSLFASTIALYLNRTLEQIHAFPISEGKGKVKKTFSWTLRKSVDNPVRHRSKIFELHVWLMNGI